MAWDATAEEGTGQGTQQAGPVSYQQPRAVRGRIEAAQPRGLPRINLGYNELPYGPTPKVAAALADNPDPPPDEAFPAAARRG